MSDKILFRCSSLGHIMHIDRATKLTEKQSVTLTELHFKEKRTEKQEEQYQKLIAKRDAPPALSQGAKTNVKDIFFSEKFNFNRRFTSKYTQKGNIVESKAIDQIVKFLGLPLVVKNEQHFSNDYIKGTPDTFLQPLSLQIDAKSVYYPHNLDTFETLDHLYKWQGHGYNYLTETNYSAIVKVLLNPPESILEKETYIFAKEAGLEYDEITDSFRDEVRDYFDFESKMPLEDRVNVYFYETTQEHIDQINQCVELAREYYEELEREWANKNTAQKAMITELLHVKK